MKLSDDKIRWMICRKMDNSLITSQIAELQGTSASRVRQLWIEYRRTGVMPRLKRPGKPRKQITQWEEWAWRNLPEYAKLVRQSVVGGYQI